jgi:hypothetical protein
MGDGLPMCESISSQRRAIGAEKAINGMVGVMIREPLNFANDALEFESEAFNEFKKFSGVFRADERQFEARIGFQTKHSPSE